MICGRYEHPASACFDEFDVAIRQMTDKVVALNAHVFPAPKGSIVYNTENLLLQVPDWKERWEGHELWDISAEHFALTGAKHVPIGWHASMERFKPRPVPDIDIVFTGCMNERRSKILDALRLRRLHVVHIDAGTLYGADRDEILARSKLALNIRYRDDMMFPLLRSAHLIANRIPVLSEDCPGVRGLSIPYDGLVDFAAQLVCRREERLKVAEECYQMFRSHPMVLPS